MPSQRTIERFGEKLHSLRVRHDMTLQGLANELGLTSHSYISELEAGKKIPTAEFVLNVARLFGVTTDELLKDELELTISE
ncbi:MAG: helix-turn-helix domain-containing protein [Acidobacteria bacterium]|nr:helix-turn-helix domain-containing protein [Acidobacteriota bacterium]